MQASVFSKLLGRAGDLIDVQPVLALFLGGAFLAVLDRKSTRLNSSHLVISYAVFCSKKTSPPPVRLPHFLTTAAPDSWCHRANSATVPFPQSATGSPD